MGSTSPCQINVARLPFPTHLHRETLPASARVSISPRKPEVLPVAMIDRAGSSRFVMQCSCGTNYSDLDGQWELLSNNSPVNSQPPGYIVFLGMCPECGEAGVKLARVGTGYDGGSSTNSWLQEHTPRDAIAIYPPNDSPKRQPVDLYGVPNHLQADYRNALYALGNDKLFGYANILARRSLEFMLEENGYKGRNLDQLIDDLMSKPSGIPRSILDNVDAIRMLGNWGAHLMGNKEVGWLDSTWEQTEWVVELWERFLEHFYVNPAKDLMFRNQINRQSSAAGKLPLKSVTQHGGSGAAPPSPDN